MKHTELIAAAAAVLTFAAPTSPMAAVSGLDLREMLTAHAQIVASEGAATEGTAQRALQLQAYISGVFEAGLVGNRYCAPATTTVGQAIAAVQAFALAHPELERQAAIATVHLALSDAYPCKRP